MALHRTGPAELGLLARLVAQPVGEHSAQQQRHDDDHDRAAGELGGGEPPADQERQDDAELEDKVRRGDLERAALANTAEMERVVGQQRRDRRLAHQRLDHRGEHEAEDQRPGDLPGHPARGEQSVDERMHAVIPPWGIDHTPGG